MVALVFPGQGSQHRGMGQHLFDEVREFTTIEKQVDALLGYSVRKLCLEDAENRLKQTQYTQPCLYIVNALHYYKLLAQGVQPAYLAGHSLGEYNALLAAGVFDLLTGLRLVQKRGELMSRASNGAMAAVVGLRAERVASVLAEHRLSAVDVANFNAPAQVVISGPAADIERAGPLFENAGASMYVPLQVSAAFHSRSMADAARSFASFLAPLSFSAPKTTVIANVTAQPYPLTDASKAIKALLIDQITCSVRWTQSVRYLIEKGTTQFKEVGPGNVLTRLIQQIQREHVGAPQQARIGTG